MYCFYRRINGAVTATKILASLAESKIELKDPIEKIIDPVRRVRNDTPLERVAVIVQKEKFVIIENDISGKYKQNVKF